MLCDDLEGGMGRVWEAGLEGGDILYMYTCS